jgi:hypothetical protein
VKVEVRQHAVVSFDRQRVLACKHALMTFETEHPVAGAHSDQAGIGGDPHDRCVEGDARLGIPTRVKRRIESEPVVSDVDRGDAVSRRPAHL